MSLEVTMKNAISGLHSSKQTLQVIANNIANVNTDGFVRKDVKLTSRIIGGTGYGVELSSLNRTVDEGILKQLRKESGTLEKIALEEDYFNHINRYFGRPSDNNSIAHLISELGSQFDSLAVTPNITTTQFTAVKAGENILTELTRLSDRIQEMRTQANTNISDEIDKLNNMLENLAATNFDIIAFKTSNITPVELQDKRDSALNDVAEILDIRYFEKSDGSYTIFTGGGATLLDGQSQTISYDQPSTMSPTMAYTPTNATNFIGPSETGYPAGGVPGIFIAEKITSADITEDISSGKLKALINLRDNELPAIQAQLDELAEKLKEEINAVHNSGASFPPPSSLTGDRYVASATSIDNSTGLVRIAVVNESGTVIESNTIDLTNANITNVGTLITNGGSKGINNLFTNLTASITSDGKFKLSASNNYRIAINELTSSMSAASDLSKGFSDFFGLNNFFSSTEAFSVYRSKYHTSSSAAAVTTGGTLQFTGNDGTAWTATVAYSTNDSISDLVTKINANSTISGENITAEVVVDGNGYRLELSDSDADEFAMVEAAGTSGTVLSDTQLRPDTRAISSRLSVRADIMASPSYVSRGALLSNTFTSGNLSSPTSDFSTLSISAGALTFTLDSSTTASISYTTGSTLTSVVSAINANSTLAAANITAEAVISGSNYSLKIIDNNGNNYWVADTGGLSVTTSQGVTPGDGSNAEDLAAEFETTVTFLEAPARGGGLAQSKTNFSNYAAKILSFNSAKVSSLQRELDFQNNLKDELFSKNASISGVNMDEELANMVVIEQAYLAAARMVATTEELFDALMEIV